MAIICTPFSEDQVYQNWFPSLNPPKMFIFFGPQPKIFFGVLLILLLYFQGQEMRRLMSSCPRDIQGEMITAQGAESVEMRYLNRVNRKIPQKHFQMEIIWTFSEFL